MQLKTGIFWHSYWRWISWILLWNYVSLSTIFFKINCSMESETRLMKNFLNYLHNLRSVHNPITPGTGCLGKCSFTVFHSICWCLLISLCNTRRSHSLILPHWKRSQIGFYWTHGSMTILQRSDFCLTNQIHYWHHTLSSVFFAVRRMLQTLKKIFAQISKLKQL